MATVVSDILEMSQVSEQSGVKSSVVRGFKVSGLTASASMLTTALGTTGIPVYGETHPSISGIYADKREAVPESTTVAKITVTYSPYAIPSGGGATVGRARYRGGSHVEQVNTNLNINGDQIILSSPNGTNVTGEVSIRVPRSTLVVDRTETTSTPGTISQTYVGKTNSTTWQGGLAGTWLCVNVGFDTADGDATNRFNMTYEFEYNENGWDPEAFPIDPQTSQPYPGSSGTVVTEYDQVNFSALGF